MLCDRKQEGRLALGRSWACLLSPACFCWTHPHPLLPSCLLQGQIIIAAALQGRLVKEKSWSFVTCLVHSEQKAWSKRQPPR